MYGERNLDITDLLERFWDKVEITPNCWNWKGYIGNNGYGMFRTGLNKVMSHRFIYEIMTEHIIDSLDLDHLCRNRSCVNPNHLQQVTRRENCLRGLTGKHDNHKHKSFCPQGHPYSGKNLYVDNLGRVVCRECRKQIDNKRYKSGKNGGKKYD